MTQTLRAASPADLAPLVPHVLGHDPGGSLVTAGVVGNRVAFWQRVDLVADRACALAAAQRIVSVLDRERPDRVVAFLFPSGPEDGGALVDALRQVAPDWCEVMELGTVRQGRYFSLDCTDASCCPPEGVPLDLASPAVATLVHSGSAPLASREARARLVECSYPATAQAVAAERGSLAPGGGWVSAWSRLLAGGAPAAGHDAPDEAAWLAALVSSARDPESRDSVVWALLELSGHDGGPVPSDGAGVALALGGPVRLGSVTRALLACVQRVDGPDAAGLLAVLGVAAWFDGDGLLAGAAADRALRLDPGHRLAALLAHCVELGVPAWPKTS